MGRSGAEELVALNGAKPPKDARNFAYLLFLVLGAAVLFPWNSYISAVDYFTYLYPNSHIDRVFSVAYIFPCISVLIYMTFSGHRYSSKFRVNAGFVFYVVAIVLVPAMDALIITERGPNDWTHYITVAALAITGMADALVQGSITGVAGQLPERYMQAFFAGTAVCAVLTNILRVITKASYPYNESGLRASSNLFFIVSGCFMAFCIVAYNLSHRLPIITYYQEVRTATLENTDSEGGDGEKVEADRLWSSEGKATLHYGLNRETTVYVLSLIPWLVASNIVNYMITLSIFPGFLAEDVHSAALGDWYPILLISAYNVFDLLGKMLTAVVVLKSHDVLVRCSFSRLLFFPLFYASLHGLKLFRTEVPVTVLTSLLGLTNGYFTSCLMIVAPKSVPHGAAEAAGVIMAIALGLGLASGSVVSFFWII